MQKETILVIGSNGQIGTELTEQLRAIYGHTAVIACDIREPEYAHLREGPFELCDVLNRENLNDLFKRYQPTQVYLLAALLSAIAEVYPMKAWDINVNGLLNILKLAVDYKTPKVFWPSSIAAFGPHSPQYNTPQYCIMDPTTVYGISKLAGERWCEYYYLKYGLDVRSLRFPGLLGWKAEPGGGTTDYAVHIFHEALKRGEYECFLQADTELPMMYMPDAIRASIELMHAPANNISVRSSYNISGISFTPSMLANEIKKQISNFRISYAENDPRQAIAASWPKSIDDTLAKHDWSWKYAFDLPGISADMLTNLRKTLHLEV